MSSKELMQAWVINDANQFIQSFKQLTDRKSYMQNRKDSFYYFDLLSNFQTEIGRLRFVLLDSYTSLKQLYANYSDLHIWRRVIQRLNDIMEVSKVVFPFQINDDLFKEDQVIQDVINFLGKKQDDEEHQPLQIMRKSRHITFSKSTFVQEPEGDESSITFLKPQQVQIQLFKESNMKYINTMNAIQNLYSDAMQIGISQFNFNFHKPLSVNLDSLYNQMMERNSTIQQTIRGYLKSRQALQVIRKSQIVKDLAHLSELQARLFNQNVIKNPLNPASMFRPKSRFETMSPIKKEQKQNQQSFILNSQKFKNKRTSKFVSLRSSIQSKQRLSERKKPNSDQVFNMNDCRYKRTLKISKNLLSAPLVQTSQFRPQSCNNPQKKNQIHSRQSLTKSKTITKILKSFKNFSNQKYQNQNNLEQNSLGSSNIFYGSNGVGNMDLGIVIRKERNLHLLDKYKINTYKQFIQMHGLKPLRQSSCF